jgi:hypothetical protein
MLKAKNIIGIDDSEAYAIVTPPQVVYEEGDNVILAKSDKVGLSYNESTGSFVGKYDFSKEGIYVVQYEVTDGAGDKYISDSVEIQVGESTEGVKVVIDNGTVSSIEIKTGWNLKALPVKGNDNVGDIFNVDGISTVWKWEGNSWKIWSFNESIMNLINNYGIGVIAKISTGEGFWVNAGKDISVEINGSEEYGVEVLNIEQGWNLVGTGKNLFTNDFTLLGSVNTVWRWTGSSWQIWSPNSSIMDLISSYGLQTISAIEQGEGFWVNK